CILKQRKGYTQQIDFMSPRIFDASKERRMNRRCEAAVVDSIVGRAKAAPCPAVVNGAKQAVAVGRVSDVQPIGQTAVRRPGTVGNASSPYSSPSPTTEFVWHLCTPWPFFVAGPAPCRRAN